jgi:RNA polymerase sigma factor (sigma-70 family)
MKQTKQLHQPIINKCKLNDAKAQMQLYNLYCQAMINISFRYVKDRFIAEDVMQEGFIKAFKNINNYKNEVPFGSWLKKIIINQSIDHLKKNKLELVAINEEVTAIKDENNWKVDINVTIDEIKEVIKSLKEKYRLVLSLYLLEGYDHAEISEILNITENTSRTHLLRGKKILKEQLKKTSYAEGY